jgi:hypothetical protein
MVANLMRMRISGANLFFNLTPREPNNSHMEAIINPKMAKTHTLKLGGGKKNTRKYVI